MKDDLGDRQKFLEQAEAGRRLMPLLPAMVRIDGANFSNFTKSMERPFDKRMSDAMIHTTKRLVEHTNARCAYTESDEISLVFYEDSMKSQIFFDGKIQKIVSQSASLATVFFNYYLYKNWPEKAELLPTFDSRTWNLPTLEEAANAFLWRNFDTVVIGRNQNPWSECNLPKMELDGVKLARRTTGGGAVFQVMSEAVRTAGRPHSGQTLGVARRS